MTTDPVDLVLSRLRERGLNPKRSKEGWACRCPAHDDRKPSLKVSPGDNGGAVLTCYRGCTIEAIVESLKLTMKDIGAPRDAGPRKRAQEPVAVKTWPTPEQAVKQGYGWLGEPTIWHPYHAANGDIVGYTLRWQLPNGKKDIRPLSLQPGGGWAMGQMAAPRPLYGLLEIQAAAAGETVYVCEGEKDADALRTLGVLVTTSAGGCKAATKADWSPMAGRAVAIVPDHDEAGEAYADEVAELATACGAASVKIVRLVDIFPAMPAGGGAHDWIEGRDAVEPEALVSQLEQLVAAAGELRPAVADAPASEERRLVIRRASEIEPRAVEWLWPGRISLGSLTIVTGMPGLSKSTLTLDIASRITTGHRWPDDTGSAPAGGVLLFGTEDDPETVVIPRLIAASANRELVRIVDGVAEGRERGEAWLNPVSIGRDLDLLRSGLDDFPECRAIVFDPLSQFINCEENSNAATREALAPLLSIAQERRLAIIAVMHLNKKSDSLMIQRIAGAGSYGQMARHILAVGWDPEDQSADAERRRAMIVVKNSYGRDNVGQMYRVVTRAGDQPGIEWEAGTVEMHAEKLNPKPPGVSREYQERRGEAVDVMRDILAGGERPGIDVEDDMKTAGFRRRQIDHAAATLDVVKRQTRSPDGRRVWMWSLPGQAGLEDELAGPATGRTGTWTTDTWTPEAAAC